MNERSNVIVFGAGNIGRGLVGELLAAAGIHAIFVEANPALTRALAEAKTYRVHLVGMSRRVHEVGGFDVLTSDEASEVAKAISSCLFAVTAVGGKHVHDVAPLIAPALHDRDSALNIVLCENMPHADSLLRESLLALGASPKEFVCVPASVERIVRRVEGALDLVGENGQTLYVESSRWQGDLPDIPEMTFCRDLEPFYARKLFTNNAGHAVLAYLGARVGCELIHDALEVSEIRSRLTELLDLAAKALVMRYGFGETEIREHLNFLVESRFGNRALADTVKRVARQPLRKLGPNERLAGLVRLLQQCGLPTESVSRIIAAALHYFDPNDAESVALRDMIDRDGPEGVLGATCCFQKTESCFHECVQFYTNQ